MTQITKLHFELSTFCNARCPGCARVTAKKLPKIHIDFWKAIENIDPTILQGITEIQLCGTFGDPILHPDFLEIIDWTRHNMPKCKIEISTNGEPHKEEWWERLGKSLDNRGHVIFGIDGLEDTHSIYRVGTDFNKIMRNASAFIRGGGEAWWQFIPFSHNEKDILAALKISRKMGFRKFFLKDVRPSGKFSPWSRSRVQFSEDQIVSPADVCLLKKGTVYIQADGKFMPCCYMGNFSKDEWKAENLSRETVDRFEKDLSESWQSTETMDSTCLKWCAQRKINKSSL